MTNKKEERFEEEGEEIGEEVDDDDENTHPHKTHTHAHPLSHRKMTVVEVDAGNGRVKKVQEDRIENENGSQSMHY